MSEAGRNPLTGLLGDQRGTVMVMVAIGMVALLGIAGLAIDASHLYVVRTKLRRVRPTPRPSRPAPSCHSRPRP